MKYVNTFENFSEGEFSIQQYDQIASILNQIIALNLKGAPKLEVRTIMADDLGGSHTYDPVRLINCLVSPETRQKYIVPYQGRIRIPCPIGDNWNIYILNFEQLPILYHELTLIDDPVFEDIYHVAESIGEYSHSYHQN